MINKLLVISILLLSFIPLNAQEKTSYTLKGELRDSLTNEPIPYATIHIIRQEKPDKPVKMLITDQQGRFSETLPAAGTYHIRLSSVGNRTVEQSFTAEGDKHTVRLGTLYTSEAVEELGGVTVTAVKPLVKAEVDKLTYNVAEDPDAEAKTVLDMLRKVPLVTVDGNDQIRLNGQTNFKIHLNGRPSSMLSTNPGEVLKSMPANTVKNIAVITNPGSKYDAEGVGGIIDIITHDGRSMEGYTATLSGSGSTLGGGHAAANGIFQIGKLSVSAFYAYNGYKLKLPENWVTTDYFGDATASHYAERSKSDFKRQGHYGNLEASYEIDTLNLLTFTLNGGKSFFNQLRHESAEMNEADGKNRYNHRSRQEMDNQYGYMELSANYQRTLHRPGELLTLSYWLSHNPTHTEHLTHYIEQQEVNYADKYNTNQAATQEHTAQIDYINPFNGRHTLETGLKYIYRNNHSDTEKTVWNKDSQTWMPVQTDLSDFDHRQHILGAYAAYTYKYKKFGLKIGTRVEHSRLEALLHSDVQPDFRKNYTDVVPNANLSFSLSDTQMLKASYNLRIARPDIGYLNPYRNEQSPLMITFGNIHLQTEKFHQAELSFSSFSQKLMLTASLYYRFSNNNILQYSRLAENQVLEYTYGNIGRQHEGGANLYLNLNLGANLSIWGSATASYTDIYSQTLGQQNSGWNGSCNAGLQSKLPWQLQLGGYGGYYKMGMELQADAQSFYYYGLYIARDFLKDNRLHVTISASDFINRYRKMHQEYITPEFRSRITNDQPGRAFQISVSYRFGDLKTSVKKVARGIVNDDLKANTNSQNNASQQ